MKTKSDCVAGYLVRRSAIRFREMRPQLHRIMQNSADLHDLEFGHAVKQEMTWPAYPIPRPAG